MTLTHVGKAGPVLELKFIRTQPTPIIYILSVAAFMLQWQKPCSSGRKLQCLLSGPLYKGSPIPTIYSFHWLHRGPLRIRMDQSGFAVSLDLNSWVVLAASPHSQFLWSWLKSPLK